MSRRTRSTRRLALVPATAARLEAPTDPAATLLDQIAAGELDSHLTAIARAIRARFDLLQTVSSASIHRIGSAVPSDGGFRMTS